MLLRRGNGEHFNAAVPQISHEAAHLQLFRGVLCEVAEAYTLDHSRHEVRLASLASLTNRQNCSREFSPISEVDEMEEQVTGDS